MWKTENLTSVVVLGDGLVGKTSLLITYVKKSFPEIYCPTVFELDQTDIMVNGKEYTLGLYDLPGHAIIIFEITILGHILKLAILAKG